MAEIYDLDTSAANNNSAPPNGFPENMDYRDVNDAARELMASLARWREATQGELTSTGSSSAYALATNQSISAYAAGQTFSFVANHANTGAATLNVDSVGAGAIVDARGNALAAGDIPSGAVVTVRRRASDFQLVGLLGQTSAVALAGSDFLGSFTTGGVADAYTATTGRSLSSLTTGQIIALLPSAANTGASTLDVDGTGAINLRDFGDQDLAADELATTRIVLAAYNGTNWRIIAGLFVSLSTDVIGILPVANGGTGAATASAAFTALKQAASETDTGVVELATTAEIRAAATGDKALTAQDIEEASAAVALSDAASITVDWDDGINFTVTLGGNRTLANPSNGQPGTWRTILFTQDGTGSRTLAFDTQYIFPGGSAPVLSTDAAAEDRLAIFCRSASVFEVYTAGLGLA